MCRILALSMIVAFVFVNAHTDPEYELTEQESLVDDDRSVMRSRRHIVHERYAKSHHYERMAKERNAKAMHHHRRAAHHAKATHKAVMKAMKGYGQTNKNMWVMKKRCQASSVILKPPVAELICKAAKRATSRLHAHRARINARIKVHKRAKSKLRHAKKMVQSAEMKAKAAAQKKKQAEKNVKREKSSKEKFAKEKAAKERSHKERKAKWEKAAKKERYGKAKVRELNAKKHERRAKAAEKYGKERSHKAERANKHRLAVERSNKARAQVTWHAWGGYLNNMDRPINWAANGHTFISGLRSFHNNHYEDRQFSPLLTNVRSTQARKHWSGWVNNMDAYFAYSCPTNYVMSGFISYHNNHYEDRRWRFQCAHFHGLGVRNGGWPGWQTSWDRPFALGCGHRPAVGFSSYHHNHYEDRRWRIQCGTFYVRV